MCIACDRFNRALRDDLPYGGACVTAQRMQGVSRDVEVEVVRERMAGCPALTMACRSLMMAGQKLPAIKAAREYSSGGLIATKTWCESLIADADADRRLPF